MEHMEDRELQDLLFELGYDKREFNFEDGVKYNRFMMQQDQESLREAQAYLDELDDCSDDYYLSFKSGVFERIRGENN